MLQPGRGRSLPGSWLGAPLVVVLITAVLRKIIPARVFWDYCLTLSWGERINLEEAVELMLDQGHVAAMRQIA